MELRAPCAGGAQREKDEGRPCEDAEGGVVRGKDRKRPGYHAGEHHGDEKSGNGMARFEEDYRSTGPDHAGKHGCEEMEAKPGAMVRVIRSALPIGAQEQQPSTGRGDQDGEPGPDAGPATPLVEDAGEKRPDDDGGQLGGERVAVDKLGLLTRYKDAFAVGARLRMFHVTTYIKLSARSRLRWKGLRYCYRSGRSERARICS